MFYYRTMLMVFAGFILNGTLTAQDAREIVRKADDSGQQQLCRNEYAGGKAGLVP